MFFKFLICFLKYFKYVLLFIILFFLFKISNVGILIEFKVFLIWL